MIFFGEIYIANIHRLESVDICVILIIATAATGTFIVFVSSLRREEFINREPDVIKEVARIVLCSRRTFLSGDTEINCINKQLRVTL